MTSDPQFLSATPVLASLEIERSADFFVSKLGFDEVYVDPGVYGVVARGSVQVHFWACRDRAIAEAASCRIGCGA